MNEQSYNGWTNYETWLVNLWLTKDRGMYGYVLGMDADSIKAYVEEMMFEEQALVGFTADLVLSTLDKVNWHEIGDSLTEDAA